jgi:pimeloyl-ACP methyl ester carboxylesterase
VNPTMSLTRYLANTSSTCALLQVPLDYSDLSAGTTNLGIIKSPADTEDAQEVLINPGGPGGSSVAQVQFGYADIQEKIGTQFSIVGIDPRGVANSGPSSDCFPGFSHIARNSYVADVNSIPDTTSDYALRQNHEYMKGYGRWCSSVYAVNQTAKYAGTVATAQDMLHYIELDAEQKGNDPKEAKLFFYGISYGTALGSTFASLYPDRIGRMIIDGVVDTEDHFNGGWETSIVDNDKVVQQFFKKCFEAGPELCHFHRNASSWTELEERFQALFEHLKQHPIAVGSLAETQALLPQNLTLTPALFTWKDLTDIMFGTLYILTPTAYAELDAILTGLLLEIHTGAAALPPKAQISSMSPSRHDERTARFLINCLYANARFNTSDFAAYKSFVGGMHNSSRYAGLKAATYSGPICSHLDVRPPESQVFDGELVLHCTGSDWTVRKLTRTHRRTQDVLNERPDPPRQHAARPHHAAPFRAQDARAVSRVRAADC